MIGRCLCGNISFTVKADIQTSYVCHCQDCQQYSGSAFQTLSIVDRKDFEINTGQPQSHQYETQDKSILTRYFCPDCSAPLYNISSRFNDIVMFSATALNDAEKIKPAFEIWTSSQLPWVDLGLDIKRYPYGAEDGDTPPG